MFRETSPTALVLAAIGLLIHGIFSESNPSSGNPKQFKPRIVHAKKITVGILQTAAHPALDSVRENFIAELNQSTQGNVQFVIQNAEGSLLSAQKIAENFHDHQKIDAIFSIGTPAAQAAALIEKKKPIFIAAVSDPDSLDEIYQGTNICGVTDQTDTESQARFIDQLLPGIQKIAILYNPGESNSCATVKKMERSLQRRGIFYSIFGVYSESEIGAAVTAASRKWEAILIPADNLLVSAMSLVAKEALKKKCPLITSDLASIGKGALAAQGIDYCDQGKKAAQIAFRVLYSGESPGQVGIIDPPDPIRIVNRKILAELEIPLPPDSESTVGWVEI